MIGGSASAANVPVERHDVTVEEWQSLRSNMWDGDFVLTASRDQVAAIEAPMLVAMGNDLYHPRSTSREIAELAPNATLVEEWKDGDALEAIDATIKEFLAALTP